MRSARLFTVVSSLAVTGAFLTATEVSGKQCVFNKGGYVLRVHWFHRGDVGYWMNSFGLFVENKAAPVKVDTLTAGFGSCNETSEVMVAYLAVVGGYQCRMTSSMNGFANERHAHVSPGISIAEYGDGGTVLKSASSLLQCKPWESGYCMGKGLLHGVNADLEFAALITEPSTTRYLDMSGAVFDIRWQQGGMISGYGWMDGVDPGLAKDAGRGITDYNAHYQWVAGWADVAAAAGFVGQRATALSAVA